MLAVPIWWGLDARFPWDVDNIAPGSVLKGLAMGFGPGWSSTYGPLPYYLTALLYLPALGLMRVGGELQHPSSSYPWGFANPEAATGALIVLARLLTMAFAIGIAWLAARDGRSRAGGQPMLVALLLLAGSPVFVYYARTSNVDAHYLFWLWLGFHFLEGPGGHRRRLAGAGLAAAFAVSSKEPSAPIGAVLVIASLVRAWRGAQPRLRSRIAALSAVGLPAAVAYLALWQIPVNMQGWRNHLEYLSHAIQEAPPDVGGLAGGSLRMLPIVLGAPLAALLLAAPIVGIRWRGLGLRAAACGLYLAALMATVGYIYPRFLLPLILVAVPLALRAAHRCAELLERRMVLGRALRAALVALALAGGPLVDALMLGDPRYAAERWLRSNVSPGAVIEIAGNPHYQARIPPDQQVVYTREMALRAAPRGPVGDVVLLSTVDAYAFKRDALLRSAWWDPLHAPPPAGAYRPRAEFFGPPLARLMWGLPISPKIEVYARAE